MFGQFHTVPHARGICLGKCFTDDLAVLFQEEGVQGRSQRVELERLHAVSFVPARHGGRIDSGGNVVIVVLRRTQYTTSQCIGGVGQEGLVIVHRSLPAEVHRVVVGECPLHIALSHSLEHLFVGHNAEGEGGQLRSAAVLIDGLYPQHVLSLREALEGKEAAGGHAHFLAAVIHGVVVNLVHLVHLVTSHRQVGCYGPGGQLGGTELQPLLIEGVELRFCGHAQQVGLPGYGVATHLAQHIVAGVVSSHSHLDGHIEVGTGGHFSFGHSQMYHILLAICQGLGDGLRVDELAGSTPHGLLVDVHLPTLLCRHGVEADTQQAVSTVEGHLFGRNADGSLEAVVAATEAGHLGPLGVVALHSQVGTRSIPLQEGTAISLLAGKEVARSLNGVSTHCHLRLLRSCRLGLAIEGSHLVAVLAGNGGIVNVEGCGDGLAVHLHTVAIDVIACHTLGASQGSLPTEAGGSDACQGGSLQLYGLAGGEVLVQLDNHATQRTLGVVVEGSKGLLIVGDADSADEVDVLPRTQDGGVGIHIDALFLQVVVEPAGLAVLEDNGLVELGCLRRLVAHNGAVVVDVEDVEVEGVACDGGHVGLLARLHIVECTQCHVRGSGVGYLVCRCVIVALPIEQPLAVGRELPGRTPGIAQALVHDEGGTLTHLPDGGHTSLLGVGGDAPSGSHPTIGTDGVYHALALLVGGEDVFQLAILPHHGNETAVRIVVGTTYVCASGCDGIGVACLVAVVHGSIVDVGQMVPLSVLPISGRVGWCPIVGSLGIVKHAGHHTIVADGRAFGQAEVATQQFHLVGQQVPAETVAHVVHVHIHTTGPLTVGRDGIHLIVLGRAQDEGTGSGRPTPCPSLHGGE